MFSVLSFVIGAALGLSTAAMFYKYREIKLGSKIFYLESELEAQEGYVNALQIRLERLKNKEAENVQVQVEL